MSFLSQPKTFKLRNTYVNGFLDCSGDIILRSGNVIIGNISQPGYNANQLSVLIHGRTEMNGNVIVNGNLLVSSNNIALGLRAGNIVNGIQDGVPNGLNTTAVGSFSGMNHTGQNNTFMGSVAGQASSTTYFSRTGNNNTYVGHRTSASQSAWGNSTAVGTGAVITASNQIVLGTAEEIVTTGGNVRITNTTASTTSTNGALVVTGGLGVGGAINSAGSISTPSTIVTNDAFVSVASTANTGYLRMVSTGSANYIQSGLSSTSDSVAPLLFTSSFNGREVMRVDVSNRRLGIGTTAPTQMLGIQGSLRVNQANLIYNKLLILRDNATADPVDSATNFFGFGCGQQVINSINYGLLRYQVSQSNVHAFFGGTVQYGRISDATSGFIIGSDRKLKKNITELDYGLNEILQLKPSRYLMKEENEGDKTHIGLIAQEVQPIIPEVVHECVDDDNTPTLMLSHIGFIPVLIRAIQQQQQHIQNLEERLKTLENSR